MPTRTQQLGLLILLTALVVYATLATSIFRMSSIP
jgi:hypothetical protein